MKERVVEWCEEEHLMYVVLMDEDEGAWSAWHGMAWRHSMKLDTYLGMTLFLSTHYIVVDIYFVPHLLTIESKENLWNFFGDTLLMAKAHFTSLGKAPLVACALSPSLPALLLTRVHF